MNLPSTPWYSEHPYAESKELEIYADGKLLIAEIKGTPATIDIARLIVNAPHTREALQRANEIIQRLSAEYTKATGRTPNYSIEDHNLITNALMAIL